MKKYFFYAAAAIALASCSNNEFLGEGGIFGQGSNGEIAFGVQKNNSTRAGELTGQTAAEKLNRQFFVYGTKSNSAEAADGTGDLVVFPNYRVIYDPNSAYSTESNTHNWEYVGDWKNYATTNVPAITGNQTIKYWDYSANNHVFHAFSLLPEDIENGNVTAEKVLSATGASPTVYDKGWTFTIKDAASLGDIYVANRVPILTATDKNTNPSGEPNYIPSDANKVGNYVNMTFRALAAKIRFALYETIPGYEVHINKLYYTTDPATPFGADSETNFTIDMDYQKASSSGTTVNVTYYDNTDVNTENQPKTTITGADAASYGIFGTNMQATPAIGVTSPLATYDYAGKDYTAILPYTSTKDMKLQVDYTLTPTDGSNATINVKHATAVVPMAYADWKPNFAYTYIFKISDNTNGTTGTPGDGNPVGLYPISFDACVVDAITDVQETITEVTEPSITTYAKGVIVTENDEYTPGSLVCITVSDGGTTQALATTGVNANSRLFEVYNHGTESITEETVANYANNFMTLVEITDAAAIKTQIDVANNQKLTISNYAFTAETGKVYAYQYKKTDGSLHYKVIKVTGDKVAEPAMTLALSTANTATNKSSTATFTVKTTTGTKNVLGIRNLLTGIDKLDIADGGDGTYTAKFKDEAISKGEAATAQTIGGYTGVSGTATVTALTYAIDPAVAVALIAGGNQNISLKIGSDVITNVVITNSNVGLTVKEQESIPGVKNGTINVAAAKDIVGGNKTITISGVDYDIPVTSYVVGIAPTSITQVDNASTKIGFTLKDNSDNALTGVASNIVVLKNGVVVAAPGVTAETTPENGYYFNVTEGGKYTVKYLGYSDEVTVNMYTLAYAGSYSNTIAQTTGSTQLNLKLNGAVTLPTATKVTIVKTDDSSAATSNFVIGTNGKNITIAAKSTAEKINYTVRYEISSGVYATTSLTVE